MMRNGHRSFLRAALRALAILWASPWTLVGLVVGGCSVLAGGGVRRIGGAIGFWGGLLPAMLGRLPFVRGATAMTLGQVVLAQTLQGLELTREHELVHVRQYERWGIFFVPAYLFCGLAMLVGGKDPYRDNPFEREAFEKS